MALVFRWYLGLSSRWANSRRAGPATRLPGLVRPGDGRVQRVGEGIVPGSSRRNRTVVAVARTCSTARASILRRQALRQCGVHLPRRVLPSTGPLTGERDRTAASSRPGTRYSGMNRQARWLEPLAIVGIGCLFPKAAGPGFYWANVKHGVDCIGEVPPTHWDPADYFDADPKRPDMTYARRGGFLDAGRLQPAGIRHRPARHRGDRHHAIARPGRGEAGTDRTAGVSA